MFFFLFPQTAGCSWIPFIYLFSQHLNINPSFFLSCLFIIIILFFLFYFIFFARNQPSFEMLISLRKCSVFKYGVKLPGVGLGFNYLPWHPPHEKERKKEKSLRGGGGSASFVTWAECSPCFQMYLNVFGLIGLQIGWHRMFSLAFIHSCNFRGTLSYISLFFIHLRSVTGFVLRNSTWVQRKLWLICTKPEDVIVMRARQGSLMRPAVGEGETWKAKVSRKITRIYDSHTTVWLQK